MVNVFVTAISCAAPQLVFTKSFSIDIWAPERELPPGLGPRSDLASSVQLRTARRRPPFTHSADERGAWIYKAND